MSERGIQLQWNGHEHLRDTKKGEEEMTGLSVGVTCGEGGIKVHLSSTRTVARYPTSPLVSLSSCTLILPISHGLAFFSVTAETTGDWVSVTFRLSAEFNWCAVAC